MPTTRRHLLQSAAGLAAAKLAAGNRAEAPALPTVRFGDTQITRLVCGANPFYGYSHFNRLLDRHMAEWMTPERVVEILFSCEQHGINTWQVHYSDRTMEDIRRYRAGGGRMNLFMLSMKALHGDSKKLAKVAALRPVGIAHHGNMTDDLFREGRHHEVREFLKAVRETGVMVGLSCHNPAVIEYAEEKDWDIDYYQACFYRVSRTGEEIAKELGEAPLGEVYLEKDPERMCAVIRQTRKPCLGFKILAAGRRTNTPEQVAKAFDYAYANVKPSDAVIVGMYPRYIDEVLENTQHVRRIHRI